MKTISNLILLLLLLVSLFYFFSYPGVDPDLWGHLFFGREILQSGKLPLQNLYSYTVPDHPWINHEWLAEVVFFIIFKLFGSPGLIILKVVFGATIIWIIDLVLKQGITSLLVRTLTLIWVMAILSPGFNIRPQIFTYLLFAFILLFFHQYERGRRAYLFVVPLLLALWVNLHGGFVVGLGALGLFSLWALLRGLWEGETKKRILGYVMLPCALSVLILFLNPYGAQLLSFLARDLLMERLITEWAPIGLLDTSFVEFKLALITTLFLVPRSGVWRRWDFWLTLLAAVFALRHQRHTPLFAIATAPFLAAALERASGLLEARLSQRLVSMAILGIAMYQLVAIGTVHVQHRFRLVVSPHEYPTQAAEFLRQNRVRGNLAVPFDWGEYLIWKLYPEVRVSIDGRYTTAYPTGVIQDHWDWMQGKEGWRKLLERYPTEIAITHRNHPVTALMRQDPEWVYIYSDPVAVIFIRKAATQQQLLERFREKQLLSPQSPPLYFPG